MRPPGRGDFWILKIAQAPFPQSASKNGFWNGLGGGPEGGSLSGGDLLAEKFLGAGEDALAAFAWNFRSRWPWPEPLGRESVCPVARVGRRTGWSANYRDRQWRSRRREGTRLAADEWHESEVPALFAYVGYWEKIGQYLLAMSFSQFGPEAVIGPIEIPQRSRILPDVLSFPSEAQETAIVGSWGAMKHEASRACSHYRLSNVISGWRCRATI
jgi:hypothetical protein